VSIVIVESTTIVLWVGEELRLSGDVASWGGRCSGDDAIATVVARNVYSSVSLDFLYRLQVILSKRQGGENQKKCVVVQLFFEGYEISYILAEWMALQLAARRVDKACVAHDTEVALLAVLDRPVCWVPII